MDGFLSILSTGGDDLVMGRRSPARGGKRYLPITVAVPYRVLNALKALISAATVPVTTI